MVTAVFGSGSLSTARLKNAFPCSGISEISISMSLSASILAQFVRDRFLVVGFFTSVRLSCRENLNQIWRAFSKGDRHEPPANESEADLSGFVVVFPAVRSYQH